MWENHYKFLKPATGLPPKKIIYTYIKGLKHDVNSIPTRLEEVLDSQKMLGQLSLDQITRRAVEQGPRLTAIVNDRSVLR